MDYLFPSLSLCVNDLPVSLSFIGRQYVDSGAVVSTHNAEGSL